MAKAQYTVFLVDDSEDDRLFMKMMLKRSPKFVVVAEASDGREAVDYLKAQIAASRPVPDLMLLDIKMPRMDGYDVLEWLEAEPLKNLSVAMISGSWLAEDVTKSMALGAHGYFKKTAIKEEQEVMVHGIVEMLAKRHGS